jgi:antitoxin component YwqK of YwqJK toxin-antitoxin module
MIRKDLAKHRVVTEKYPDGSLKKETPYLDDKIHGEVKEYWPGGKQIKSLTRYAKGLREGIAETYFDNGRIETRVPYRNDRMEGLFERWDNPTAKRDAYGNTFQPVVIEQVPYVNGLKEGVRKTWRRVNDATSGVLALEEPYVKDKLHGEVKGYGPGDGRSIRRYKDGLQDGLEEHFSATGKLEVNWSGGKQHGLTHFLLDRYGYWPRWQEEWANGARIWRKEFDYFMLGGFTKSKKIETYNNARKLHGKSEFWSDPDKREKTLEFANGVQHGVAEYYDPSGTKVIRREEWHNGAKVRDLPI